MQDEQTSRLTRLTSILIQLQSRRITSAANLAARFGVSTRTIYRDIRTLEQSGVPVVTEEGKGYSLMEGYRMPPVSFMEHEANALITAEQLVLRNMDASFVKDYTDAVTKIRSVLRQGTKDRAELLSSRIAVSQNEHRTRSSEHLSSLQQALTSFQLVDIAYQKEGAERPGWRSVEPFALLSGEQVWILAAWCRLRKEFRLFRLDRIMQLRIGQEHFEPHKLKLEEYLNMLRGRSEGRS
jgi:predicted DNA-binding transcriptional regulator YafY